MCRYIIDIYDLANIQKNKIPGQMTEMRILSTKIIYIIYTNLTQSKWHSCIALNGCIVLCLKGKVIWKPKKIFLFFQLRIRNR
jgi:predicted RNA-binding protein with PUA domain